MRVFITDKAEETAGKLMRSEDMLISVSELISGERTLPEDMDKVVFVFPAEHGCVTPALQHYLENGFAARDNTALEYVAGVCTTQKKGLALYILESLLYGAGTALPYSVAISMKNTVEKIRKDLDAEEIEVHGRIPLSRFISRFKLRANRRRYYG